MIILFIQLPIKVSLAFHPDVPINSGVVTHMVRLAILLYHPRNSLCLAIEVK